MGGVRDLVMPDMGGVRDLVMHDNTEQDGQEPSSKRQKIS
jgi:hypothetical protein